MYFNVQIVSTETIIPFSPTPLEKIIYKRSLLDQLTPLADIDCVLFYPNAVKLLSARRIHDKLKLSLSKALAHFYPLAGRANGAFFINCNDRGISYTEAQVPCDLSRVITNLGAPNHPLLELIPEEQLTDLADNDRALLSVQVNTFACGGIAIGVKCSHAIADASAFASFLSHWAEISRDPISSIHDDHRERVVVDYTSLFRPRDFPVMRISDFITPEKAQAKRVVKRFVFDGSKITSLRESFGGGRFSQNGPTRFEALATLVWVASINIARNDHLDQTSNKSHFAFLAVNLRKRIDPPLPERSLGCTIQTTMVEWPMNKPVDVNELAGKLRDSIRFLNDPNVVRDLHSNDKYFNTLQGFFANFSKNANLCFGFSSWCRFPFYETDFGWGKPDLVATSLPLHAGNGAIFIDAKDGEGIEVWVGLPREDMARFEKDSGILHYASFIPTSTTEE